MNMARITVVQTVNTWDSRRRAAEWLAESKFDSLFLDLPMDLEGFIKDILLGADCRHMIQHMKDLDLLKDPEDVRTYRMAEPILQILCSFDNSKVQVYCYADPMVRSFAAESAEDIAALTKKAEKDEIDVEQWKELLKEEIMLSIKAAEDEGRYIARRAKSENVCLNASEEVKDYLADLGYTIETVELDKPCQPLDILNVKLRNEVLSGKVVPDPEVKRLIADHVKFSNLVVEKDYEEAYNIWKKNTQVS